MIYLRRLLPVLVLFLSGCLCLTLTTGCKIQTKNQGEVGFRYGTEFTFFSRAAQTAPEPATIESSSQPLSEWIKHKETTP